jgi:hypothetical protein
LWDDFHEWFFPFIGGGELPRIPGEEGLKGSSFFAELRKAWDDVIQTFHCF